MLTLGIVCAFTPVLLSADKECPLAAAKAGKTCPLTGKVLGQTVAATGEKDCEKACAKAQTVAATGAKECCKDAKAQTVAATGKKDCDKAGAKTVAAAGEKDCAKSKTVAAAGKVCPVTGKVIQTAAAGEKDCEKACAKAQTVAAAGKADCGAVAKAGCPIEKAVHDAATVMFRVGNYQTSDPQAAGAVAARTEQAMKFIVGEESFCNVADAADAINKRIDAKIGEMTTVSYAVGEDCVSCPNAAATLAKEAKTPVMYRVVNVDFKDREAAEKAAERAKQAVSSTLMAYKVGEESFCCDKMAGEAAVANGKPVQYLIQGQATSCQLDAALKMATAKMQALFQAVAAPQAS
jgi:hypothetical protein